MKRISSNKAISSINKPWRILPCAAFAVYLAVAFSALAEAQEQIGDEEFDTFDTQEAIDSVEVDLRNEQERAHEAELVRELNLRQQAIDVILGNQVFFSVQLYVALFVFSSLFFFVILIFAFTILCLISWFCCCLFY